MSIGTIQSGSRARRVHVADKSKAELSELLAGLQASLDREQRLRREVNELTRRHAIMEQEQAHRFANGIQFIVSTLERQSRLAQAPEVKGHLKSASIRILALHRIQRRIHECTESNTVAIGDLLRKICDDLSLLLYPDEDSGVIAFEGAALDIPATTAVPLALAVNELITNAAKYAAGKVTVRFECDARSRRHVSVTDDGPGLPVGFQPNNSQGLGMRIVSGLVGQIGGELRFTSGPGGHGTCCTISF